MQIKFEQTARKNYFYISLLLVIIGELLINFFKYGIQPGSVLKLFIHSHIYISIFFLLFAFEIKDLKQFDSNFLSGILFFLLIYSIFEIFRFSPLDTNLYVSNPFFARFGNIWYGPMFLVPLFILWGLNKNSIYWFEKISINMVKIGVVLFLLSFLFKFQVSYVFFLSSFYLLASYSSSNNTRKLWIIIAILISIIIFYDQSYRSGILRIILAIICVLICSLNLNILKKFLIIFFILTPMLLAYDVYFNDPSIFQKISQMGDEKSAFFVDTRTFLFQETFLALKSGNNLLLGLGAMGNYYSKYFYDLMLYFPSAEADFYIRSKVEVGFLQMLLKGGLLYILIISSIYLLLISKNKFIKNTYTENLFFISLSNFFFMSIENVPAFNYLNSLIWIILGICFCYTNQIKNDQEIKDLLSKKNT